MGKYELCVNMNMGVTQRDTQTDRQTDRQSHQYHDLAGAGPSEKTGKFDIPLLFRNIIFTDV